MKNILFLAILGLLFFTGLNQLQSQQIAFPTAEGYGKYTVGGRGGSVIEVTNLNASGTGSFRAACEASGPRTVVFRVAGTIDADISISNDYITIAGQSAPGDGITLKGKLSIGASNVIIRFIRVRAEGSGDAVSARGPSNIILDHVSSSWSSDEVMSLYRCANITIQWCMITEACSTDHRFGGIWGGNYNTYHHNLIAHNESRNPRWASGCQNNDYRNNVIYNWGYNSCYGAEKEQPGDDRYVFSNVNMIANYYKPGPGTLSEVRSRIADPSSRNGDADAGKWWVSDNFMEGSPEVTADNWKGMTQTSSVYRLNEPWPAMAIAQQTAEEAYLSVLEHVGCSFPNRDIVDARIIEEVRNGTAVKGEDGFVSTPSIAGGWPSLNGGTALTDTDHDGMPDSWELSNGMNPNSADNNGDIDGDGFTNLEEYLDGLVNGSTTDTYSLTTSTIGNGSISPTGGSYSAGATVTLTATPETGWQFSGWSGALTGTANPAILTMDSNKSVTATFSETSTDMYSLTTSVNGQGSVSPSSGSYSPDSEVTLTATPSTGWHFVNWSGDASGTSATMTITMDSDQSITANFEADETGGGCDNPVTISTPFNKDGAGEFCWQTTGDISYVNSWNLGKLEINGVDFTNTWSDEMPPKQDGYYNIHYVAEYSWAHFEIASTKSAEILEGDKGKVSDFVIHCFPNPVRDKLNILFSREMKETVDVYLIDVNGNVVLTDKADGLHHTLDVSGFPIGLYTVKISIEDQHITERVVKQ